MSVNPLRDWVLAFFKRRNLSRQTGKMLFSYQATAVEYEELGELLRAAFNAPEGLEHELQSTRRRALAAASVLYFAECWRRVYSGGVWDWDPLLETLGVAPEALSANARSRLIEEGLWFWGLQPLSTGKRFIGAIAVNGGIPSRLLAQGSGKLPLLLSSALAEVERYRLTDSQIRVFLDDRQSLLPDAYQQPALLELLGQLVRCVTDLKAECGLDSCTDPIAHLDATMPDWRARFPIALDSDTAQSLLTSLVREAAARKSAAAHDLFRCERRLVACPDGSYALESIVRFPGRALGDDAAAFFGRSEADDLPRFFSVDLMVDTRRRLAEARATLGSEERAFRLVGTQRVSRGRSATMEHVLHLVSDPGAAAPAGLNFEPVTVPGGGALDEDDPWVFARANDETLQHVSSGAARLSGGEAVLALGDGWSVECEEGVPSNLGVMSDVEPARRIVRIQADATLSNGPDVFRIRLNQVQHAQSQYQWRGLRLAEAQGRHVFRSNALPSLYRLDGDLLARVPTVDQVWKRAGQEAVVTPKTAVGPLEVRVLSNGELLARSRVTVLPPDAKIAYEPGDTIHSARIRFVNWGEVDVWIETTEAAVATIDRGGPQNEVTFDLRATQEPPAHLKAVVRWRGAGSRTVLPLLLPFPVTGGRFIDSNGAVIGRARRLTVEELPGLRVQIFDANPNHAKRYALQLSAGTGAMVVSEMISIVLEQGRTEIRLFEHQRRIENLMSHFDQLDVSVTISLLAAGSVAAKIAVARYSAVLEFEGDSIQVKVNDLACLTTEDLGGIELMACSTAAFGSAPKILPVQTSDETHARRWNSAELDDASGPWLIYPSRKSSIQFRPSIFSRSDFASGVGPGIALPDGDPEEKEQRLPATLGEAMGLPTRGERWSALHQVLTAMDEEMDHPGWDELRNIWHELGHLPLAALDLWRVMGRHSQAMLSMVLRIDFGTEDLAVLLRRLRNEIGWTPELITRKELAASVEAQRRRWAAKLPEEIVLDKHLRSLSKAFEVLVAEFPSVQPLVDWAYFQAGGAPTSSLIDVSRPSRQLAKERLGGIWEGQESLVNTQLLLLNSGKESWPGRDLFERSLTAFQAVCDRRFLKALDAYGRALFWPNISDRKCTVANLPMLCALWSLTSAPRTFWGDASNRKELRLVRDFDLVWFEQAYRQSLLALMGMPEISNLLMPAASASISVQHVRNASGLPQS